MLNTLPPLLTVTSRILAVASLDIPSLSIVRQIPLTRGYFATVDGKDYDALAQWKWRAEWREDVSKYTIYAVRSAPGTNGKKRIYMHRQIMNTPPGMWTDHIDSNGLNNRRSNLRLCTHAENQQNARPRKGASSRYKGVSWHKVWKKWHARIRHNGKIISLGYFTSEIEAALAYNEAAIELFGEFAWLNIVQPSAA